MESDVNIDLLLAKQLSGELDINEGKYLEKWIENNRDEYSSLLNLVDSMESSGAMFDADTAWNRVEDAIDFSDFIKERKKKRLSALTGIAAAILFILGFTLLKINDSNYYRTYTAQNIKSEPLTLSDGSTFTLNRYSELAFQTKKDIREAHLTGEAFFEIKHDSTKPFIVRTPNFDVYVVGTSFNINVSNPNNQTVTVKTGRVLVVNKSDSVFVDANNEVIIENSNIRSVRPIDTNSISWLTGKLIFESISMIDVIPVLERHYEVKFIIDGDISPCRISTTFNNESIKDVMRELKLLLGFKFRIDGDTIRIYDIVCK